MQHVRGGGEILLSGNMVKRGIGSGWLALNYVFLLADNDVLRDRALANVIEAP